MTSVVGGEYNHHAEHKMAQVMRCVTKEGEDVEECTLLVRGIVRSASARSEVQCTAEAHGGTELLLSSIFGPLWRPLFATTQEEERRGGLRPHPQESRECELFGPLWGPLCGTHIISGK